jgi:Tol biopolymer transport system component
MDVSVYRTTLPPVRSYDHAFLLLALVAGCSPPERAPKEPLGYLPTAVTSAQPEWIPFAIRAGKSVQADPRERHIKDLRQLTYAQGENAEGYWSPDGKKLIFQSTRDGKACDQIYTLDLATGEQKRISSGEGATTCSYFFYPRADRVLYSSTHAAGTDCPPKPERSLGYVWPLDEHDIYTANPDGSARKPLITRPGYDAESTIAPDGSRLVFTSTRDGDIELYTAKLDGTDVRRITHAPGYDGGAFFSPNSARLVWRASRPTGQALDDYRALLAKHLVRPTSLEIMVAGADGQNARAITKNGKANFAPYFFADSRRVIFASNVDASHILGKAPNFDLYVVDADGPAGPDGVPPMERATYYEGFDSFPMFSPDGQYIVFASNRYGSKEGETNLFVARWTE